MCLFLILERISYETINIMSFKYKISGVSLVNITNVRLEKVSHFLGMLVTRIKMPLHKFNEVFIFHYSFDYIDYTHR